MRLWILRPVDEKSKAWQPWFDKTFGFIIEAEAEIKARELANNEGGDENRGGQNPWLDPKQSTCQELLPIGEERVIMEDFCQA